MKTLTLLATGVILHLLSPAAFGADAHRTQVILGTATPGGGFQLFGQTLAQVINAGGDTIHIREQPTRGSKQNLPLLEQGRIDIALVEGNAARQALDGVGRARADLKVLSVMYPNPGMFVVRADSPYRTIADLRGKPIAFGTAASGLRILVNDVLDGIGLSPTEDFEQIILSRAAEGPGLVLEGKAEALWGAGIGWPGFVKVANSKAGARFIAPDAEQIQRILEKHPHLKPMAVPAHTYQGQSERIDSVGLWSLILVRPDLPDEVVYQLARAIHRGQPALASRLDQGKYTTAQNTVDQVPAGRLHAGAARYYTDAGLLQWTSQGGH